jgi:2-keto-3-deoxy-L-rhamnonate aldolase RhmA
MLRENPIKHTLRQGRVVLGTMISEMRSPAVGLIMAGAGFDFMFIDMEHGAYTIETVADLIKVARLAGIAPLVRVPDPAYFLLSRPLDAGAMGLMIPRVEDVATVEHIVRSVKFPPRGSRGVSTFKGHSDYSHVDTREFTRFQNDETLVILQIERRRAIEQIEDIAAVPGVDVCLIGPNDLTLALGAESHRDPIVVAAIERVIAACDTVGIASGIHTGDVEELGMWMRKGMRMITCSNDTAFLSSGASQVVRGLRELAAQLD